MIIFGKWERLYRYEASTNVYAVMQYVLFKFNHKICNDKILRRGNW